MTTSAELHSYLLALQTSTLSEREIYHSIHEFGREHFLDAREVVEHHLYHADPQFRYVALDVVGKHWHLVEHWHTAVRFLIHDIDADCRRMGASVLGSLMRDTQDMQTLHILATIVANAYENTYVRQTAYSAMRQIVHYDVQEQWAMSRGSYDLQRDADWEWVATFLSYSS